MEVLFHDKSWTFAYIFVFLVIVEIVLKNWQFALAWSCSMVFLFWCLDANLPTYFLLSVIVFQCDLFIFYYFLYGKLQCTHLDIRYLIILSKGRAQVLQQVPTHIGKSFPIGGMLFFFPFFLIFLRIREKTKVVNSQNSSWLWECCSAVHYY
jgi:hypothetical protein